VSPIDARRVTAAGVTTRVLESGTGDPVVCVHGNPDSADQWTPLLERASELGRVIAPDLPGWGQSDPPDRAVHDGGVGAHARWFAALLEELGVDRYRLVVHDWGAVALAGALLAPERVRRAVIVDIVPLSADYGWHWIARTQWRPRHGELAIRPLNATLVDWLVALQGARRRPPRDWVRRLRRDLDPAMKDSILRLYRSGDPDVLGRAGARLGELACPALVIWGEKDPYVGADHAHRIAERLPDAETWIVPGAGHWCMHEEPAVYDRIAAFLAD
jgi:pimeloyl-ACP methyl ester carboxylesterase